MKPRRPRIAVCVVTYESEALVEDLIRSIPAGCAETEWTLVFADNASTDETIARIRSAAPEALIVQTGENLGYAGGVNAAMRSAGVQDAYLVVNADVRLSPGCARTLFEAIGPGVGITVPQLRNAAGDVIWSMRREPTLLRAWADAVLGAERAGRSAALGEVVTNPALYASAGPTDWAEGSTQLLSAECWRACGPWDDTFFLYSEETDFNLRARDAGYLTWYEPAATATHLEGGSATSPRQWSLLVVNRIRLYRRRHGPIRTGFFWLAVLMREGSRALLGRETSRAAVRDLLNPVRLRQRPSAAWLAGVTTRTASSPEN